MREREREIDMDMDYAIERNGGTVIISNMLKPYYTNKLNIIKFKLLYNQKRKQQIHKTKTWYNEEFI